MPSFVAGECARPHKRRFAVLCSFDAAPSGAVLISRLECSFHSGGSLSFSFTCLPFLSKGSFIPSKECFERFPDPGCFARNPRVIETSFDASRALGFSKGRKTCSNQQQGIQIGGGKGRLTDSCWLTYPILGQVGMCKTALLCTSSRSSRGHL